MNRDRTLADVRRLAARSGAAIGAPGQLGRWVTARWSVTNPWDAARILDVLSEQDATHPDVRELARMLARSSATPAAAIHSFVQQGVRFEREPGEVFQHPAYTLAVRSGDCDDHARLVRALANACGIPARLAFFQVQGQPAHVFAELLIDQTWTPAETTIAAELGEHPLDAARRLGVTSRPDLAGETIVLDHTGAPRPRYLGDVAQLEIVPATLALDPVDIVASPQASGWPSPPARSSGGWQSDPGRTQWAADVFRRIAPDLPEHAIHAALAVSAIETGIGRTLGNNFGGIMSRTQVPGNPPATTPAPVAACPAGAILGTDVTQQDGIKRWVCFDNPPTPQEGARRFIAELRRHTPNELASGDASRIAAEMYATHYYSGITPSASTEIARYAAAMDGAAGVIAKHLGVSQLVTRPGLMSTLLGVAIGAGAAVVLHRYAIRGG